jgi:hypothetical protein
LAEALINCPYDTVPMDVIPVHRECRTLREGVRSPAEERVLFRPFVQLYDDPWGDLFPQPPKPRDYTLVVVGSSLKGTMLKNAVKALARDAKAVIVINPEVPSALNNFDPYFVVSGAETAADIGMSGESGFPPVQAVIPAHQSPCVPRDVKTREVSGKKKKSTQGPSEKRSHTKRSHTNPTKPAKGPAEDDLPGPPRKRSRKLAEEEDPGNSFLAHPAHLHRGTEAKRILPFPQAFLRYATREEMDGPWNTSGRESISRADLIKLVRNREKETQTPKIVSTSGPSRRYLLPSEHVDEFVARPYRVQSSIDLTGEPSEDEDSEEEDSEEGEQR